jgi:cell wall-associated NlpC family hydrolase
MPVKGSYLLLAGLGGVVVWSGLKGFGVSSTLRDILSGKNPSGQKQTNAIAPATYPVSGLVGGSSAGAAGLGNSQIANLAIEYIGFPYTWGGAPANGSSDCSGFVNMIVGWFAGMAIPGYAAGTYKGQQHGPATVQWLVWSGVQTVPLSAAQAGDLAVWQTHMGIIVDNGQHMVSDLNPQLGTQETTISGGAPPGEILSVKRLIA